MWVARFLKVIPAIRRDHPTARFIFLTLTVQNCELDELRATLKTMTEAYTRLQRRKEWPAIGWLRSTEVTRGKDDRAHPHFHCLLMVQPGYFRGQSYLSQADWTELWKAALKAPYTPVVDVRAVKPNSKRSGGQNEAAERIFGTGEDAALSAAIVETLKYSVKPNDLLGTGSEADKAWLETLTAQLAKTRAVAIGGVLKGYLSESDPEDLVSEEAVGELVDNLSLWFGWRHKVQRYVKEF
jgi:plasmid rolling circle replication initiator protein Rep